MIICFEGADRLGKTTQAKLLAKKLNCEYVKFPNEDVYSGRKIRELLNFEHFFEPASFQALQTLNKIECIEKIKTAEKKHGNVVLDRFTLSCVVYGLADDLPEEFVRFTANLIPIPDVTFLMQGEAFGEDSDVYGSREYQEKVVRLYVLNADKYTKTLIPIVNCYGKTAEDVHSEIITWFECGCLK